MGSDDSSMGPLTAHRPKAFLPVAGRPLLERQLEACARAGLARVVVIYGGPHRGALATYLAEGNWWGIEVSLTAEPAEPNMGMPPANSAPDDSPILIMLGDLLVSPQDLQGLLAQPGLARGAVGPSASSRIPVFRVPIAAWPRLAPLAPAELEAGFDRLSQNGLAVADYPLAAPWLRLAHPWDLLAAAEVLLAGLQPRIGAHSVIESGVTMKGPVEIGPRSVIRSGVYIEGPVRIGADCAIGPNCYIRPATAIGDRCHIGAAVEIKNSLIFSGTAVPHLSYVGDSIIAEDCNLGAGTVIANLRHDERAVRMLGRDTGRRKLGAVIGARVKTGINVSIGRPGTVIGNDCRIAPGVVVLQDVPDGAVVSAGAGRSKARELG
ncbi:MAG: NTP transferase domain-containing protein [Chloroflexi bacterium]|nr:NTP transferase domain-containing protein [Chloroflexota bacterium]